LRGHLTHIVWITIQLGSREHYAVPAALQSVGALESLITDVWCSERLAPRLRPWLPALASRRNAAVPEQRVVSWTMQRLLFDARSKLKRSSEWTRLMERNKQFGAWATKQMLSKHASVLFSYSYTARQPFRQFAGLKLLGQIDPGPGEQEIVADAARDYEKLAQPESLPPDDYWRLWREEVELADRVVVNSAWSAQLLSEAGVARVKMVEIPLVYAPKARSEELCMTSDEGRQQKLKTGNAERLKALFLGSAILRKGVGQLFDAIKLLRSEPVDFTFAGPIGVRIPDEISSMSNVRFLGPVDKTTTERLYREADVFLFPTLSDGFGLTQLEALGHGLPVIASRNCGQVVEDRVNGLVLPEVSPETIADAIMEVIRDPDLLARLKANACVPDKCHPRHLAPALLALE
jgi:glycosyltransferase involved in cell wall biosynthesis